MVTGRDHNGNVHLILWEPSRTVVNDPGATACGLSFHWHVPNQLGLFSLEKTTDNETCLACLAAPVHAKDFNPWT